MIEKKGPHLNFGLQREAHLAPKREEYNGIRLDESAPASELVNALTKEYGIADSLATLLTKKGFVVEVKNGGLGPRQGDSCKQGPI